MLETSVGPQISSLSYKRHNVSRKCHSYVGSSESILPILEIFLVFQLFKNLTFKNKMIFQFRTFPAAKNILLRNLSVVRYL